jgi:hypothetical protein
METELETITFYVKPVYMDIGNDDHEISVNSGMLFAIFAGIVALIIIILWILFMFSRKKDSSNVQEEMEEPVYIEEKGEFSSSEGYSEIEE